MGARLYRDTWSGGMTEETSVSANLQDIDVTTYKKLARAPETFNDSHVVECQGCKQNFCRVGVASLHA